METIELTCAAALIKFLKNQYIEIDGVQTRFVTGLMGIFGHGNVAGLGQAISENSEGDFPFFQPKNEQAMVHSAIAYSKSLNRSKIYACTSSVGPGATNMITGAATATTNRIPVLLLPSDIFANRIPNPVLQQLEHPLSHDISVNDCFKPVSKFWDRINRPEQILTSLPEAMRVLVSPSETGAVTICLPEDVQAQKYHYPKNFFDKKVHVQRRMPPTQIELNEFKSLVNQSEKPLIIAGGGVHYSQATEQLKEFCDKFKIACSFTQAGTGALSFNHEYSLGAIGTTGNLAANSLAEISDLVIGLGCRYSDFTTASKTQFKNKNVKFINININEMDSKKHGAFSIPADIKETLSILNTCSDLRETNSEYQDTIKKLKQLWIKDYQELTHPLKDKDSLWHQSELIRVLNDFTDQDCTIVHAAGGLPGDLHKLWRSKESKDYHSEYAYSCMGYEIAGALGVKLATPHREVYAILGDGSYLMLNHEIVTSIQESKKITIILVNNNGYQCIHNLQRGCGGKSFGNEFRYRENEHSSGLSGETIKIDFLENAKSLGAKIFSAFNEQDFKIALGEAKKENGTTLIYTEVEPSTPLKGYSWWDVPISEVSNDKNVQETLKKYKEMKKEQRFYY